MLLDTPGSGLAILWLMCVAFSLIFVFALTIYYIRQQIKKTKTIPSSNVKIEKIKLGIAIFILIAVSISYYMLFRIID